MLRSFDLFTPQNKHFTQSLFFLLCLGSSMGWGAVSYSDTELLLEPPPVFEDNPVFAALQDKEAETPAFESQKIEYLLDRIMHTTCIFIRNRGKFSGAIAALHMRWKYSRYYEEIKTAEDFARKIADSSRKTREKYKVKMNNGKIYNTDQILLNELAHLDHALEAASTASYDSIKPNQKMEPVSEPI